MVARGEEGSSHRPKGDFEQGKLSLGEWVGFPRQERGYGCPGRWSGLNKGNGMSVRQE